MINLLWDLDGTLIDSMPIIARCLNKTADHFGKPNWDASRIRSMIGPELGLILAEMLSLSSDDDVAQAKEIYRSFYTVEMLNSPVFDGISESLSQLAETGVSQFVATAKYEDYASKIIQNSILSSRFKGIYGSEENGHLGNKKELLAKILSEEQILPSQTIMIGDTRYDIEAGRHHNLTTIAVQWGYGTESELRESGAHYFVDHPSELVSVVKTAATCDC
jgi:phosphoglycolate phosphatase